MKLRDALLLGAVAVGCAWLLTLAADWLARATFGLFS